MSKGDLAVDFGSEGMFGEFSFHSESASQRSKAEFWGSLLLLGSGSHTQSLKMQSFELSEHSSDGAYENSLDMHMGQLKTCLG